MKKEIVVILCAVLLIPLSVRFSSVVGEPNTLVLEHEEEWCEDCTEDDDFEAVTTLVVGNADAYDARPEIVIGETSHRGKSIIRAYEWNGIKLKDELQFQGAGTGPEGWKVRKLALGDVNQDGYIDIVAVGEIEEPDGSHTGYLVIYTLADGGLFHDASVYWSDYDETMPTDFVIGNPDGGPVEIFTAAQVSDLGSWKTELRSWHWTGGDYTIDPVHDMLLPCPPQRVTPHLDYGDVDGDSQDEIVIVGRALTTPHASGYIFIYEYDSSGFQHQQKYSWAESSHVAVSSVGLEDVDNDNTAEIVVGGGLEIPEADVFEGAIWIFYVDGPNIWMEDSQAWSDSWVRDVSIYDVDADGVLEIVTAGEDVNVDGALQYRSQLTIWNYDGSLFENELAYSFEAYMSYLAAVDCADADEDLEVEIFAGGHITVGGNPDPAYFRIWTWNTPPSPPTERGWPMFHHDMANRGYSMSAAPSSKGQVWQYRHLDSYGRFSHTTFSPVAANGVVLSFVGGVVYAFDYYNLQGPGDPLLWFKRVVPEGYVFVHPGVASLAIHDDRVYYAGADLTPTANALLVALDLDDGSELWRKDDLEYQSFSGPPTPYGERLFVSTHRISLTAPHGELYCFDRYGNEIWNFAPEEYIVSSAAVYGTSVFIRAGAELYSLPVEDPNGDGTISIPDEINWVFDMGTWTSGELMEIAGSPTVQEGVVYIGSHDGYLYALPVDDPTPETSPKEITMDDIIWKSPQLGDYVPSTPAVPPYVSGVENYLFVGADWEGGPGFLYKIDISDGSVIGSVQYGSGVFSSSPAIADNKIFMWGSEGRYSYLYAYDMNLNLLWNLLVDETPFGTTQSATHKGNSPAIADGIVFVGNGQAAYSEQYPMGDEGFIFAVWE